MTNENYDVLIVGGGAAGVSVANDISRHYPKLNVTLIEPSEKHYYQPAFTLVGAGAYPFEKTIKNQKDIINPKVNWVKEFVDTFQPDENQVTLRSGAELKYDCLVVCPGLQLDIDKIKGLRETLGKNGVCSNYSADVVEYTFETLKNLKSGNAFFTQPPMPIKCAGAPQKAMYLSADYFKKQGVSKDINIEFFNATPSMFGVPFFAKELIKVVKRYDIAPNFNTNLVEIDGPNKTATFEVDNGEGQKERISKSFDMIHVTPPQSAPDFIKQSSLSNDAGWLDVDQFTLQHNKFSNVFGLGDVTSTLNAKTAAAVRKQVPVVVENIVSFFNKASFEKKYDGYGSCPLTTSLGKVMLAEFTYDGKVEPSFPLMDPRKERGLWWFGKVTGFPWLYWKLMIRGGRFDIPHKAKYVKKFLD